jgi:DNA repair photolyase
MLGRLVAQSREVFTNLFGAWSMSPYHECSLACVYCNADAQGNSRPALPPDDLVRTIREKLREIGPGQFLTIGTTSDPYPALEGELGLMRRIIAALTESGTDFVILTRSSLVLRDVDLLAGNPHCKVVDLAVCAHRPEDVARLEPGAPSYEERRDAVRALRAREVPTIVAASPWIPGVTDVRRFIEDFRPDAPIIVRALDLGSRTGALRLEFGLPERTPAAAFFSGLTQAIVNRAYLSAALEIGSSPGVAWMAPPGTKTEDQLFSPMSPELVREYLAALAPDDADV